MPEIVAYPTSPFRLGGRVYLRGERMVGLTAEEMEFYKKRGVVNDKPPKKGSNLTRLASAPVAPMTTQDAPNKPAPAPAPVQAPAEEKPPVEDKPEAPKDNAIADAAKQLAERTRLAAERITSGKKGK